MIRRSLGLLAAALVTGLVATLAFGADPAWAHAELVTSTPANGTQVDAPPKRISLRFSEAVDVGLGSVRVMGPSGAPVKSGRLDYAGSRRDTVAVPLRGTLASGTYTVVWRVISADSHPIQGAFVFTVTGSASTSTPAPQTGPSGAAAKPSERAGGTLSGAVYGVARGVAFAGLALLVGTAFFVPFCWPGGARRRRLHRLLWGGWLALVASTLVALVGYGPAATKQGLGAFVDPAVLQDTLHTRSGIALTVRLVLVALATGGVVALLRFGGADDRRSRVRNSVGVLVGAVALAATWGAASHSGVGSQAPVAMVVDAVHLVAMAVWVGGLLALGAVLLPAREETDVREPVRRFSTTALSCVGLLVATGIYQSWRQVGGLSAFADTAYGRLLLVKITLVAVLVGLAAGARAWVRRHTVPADAGAPIRSKTRRRRRRVMPDVSVLRRSVVAEAGIAAAVLALTAALVNTESARSAHATAEAAAKPVPTAPAATPVPTPGAPEVRMLGFDADAGKAGRGVVQLAVDPARVGQCALHLSVLDLDGRPRDVPEVRATISHPGRSVGPIPLRMVDAGSGHFLSVATFPLAGQWKVDVTVRTSEFDQATVTTRIGVAQS